MENVFNSICEMLSKDKNGAEKARIIEMICSELYKNRKLELDTLKKINNNSQFVPDVIKYMKDIALITARGNGKRITEYYLTEKGKKFHESNMNLPTTDANTMKETYKIFSEMLKE